MIEQLSVGLNDNFFEKLSNGRIHLTSVLSDFYEFNKIFFSCSRNRFILIFGRITVDLFLAKIWNFTGFRNLKNILLSKKKGPVKLKDLSTSVCNSQRAFLFLWRDLQLYSTVVKAPPQHWQTLCTAPHNYGRKLKNCQNIMRPFSLWISEISVNMQKKG